MDIFLVYILMLIIPMFASFNVNNNYKKYKKVKSVQGLTGFEVAQRMLEENGLSNIYIVENPGELSDCYDSSRKVVKLSKDVFHGDSVAALSIAAHECGHAIQDKEGYFWMRVRSAIFPIISIGTNLSYFVLIIGLFLQSFDLVVLAIALVGLALVFQLITLPVEFDASKRARAYLDNAGLVDNEESEGVTKVLGSAALTYVAGVVVAALEVLQLIMIYLPGVGGRDD